MNWYLEVLKKYADFNGRARRKEYWMFTLFNCIFCFGYCIFAMLAIVAMGRNAAPMAMLIFVPYWLYTMALLIPSLAVTVRRLHDTGRSGWWLLISLVPFVGGIILLVFVCSDSQPGPNLFGPNPKGIQAFGQYMPAIPRY
ncbi:DUF805 domain-containing protein [Acidicapsa dinghuensis]|uniref:DUF805 domain-containing protein n=1 Tax=Acidicapsa dinghuensis TaxID=2218256 RepID=A0ABW1EMQ3_9BACT|nr:DUF805 domain-containing protein [Acidicapsa dinghuensis]